jgi:hypothetical protein
LGYLFFLGPLKKKTAGKTYRPSVPPIVFDSIHRG